MDINERRNERGSALLIALIATVAMMGLIAAMSILTQEAAKQSQTRIEYAHALELADMALKRKIIDVLNTSIVEQNQALPDGGTRLERVGLVGANLADPSTDYYCDFAVNLGDYDCTVRVYSAYYAHRNNAAGSGFLEDVSVTERNSDEEGVFDIYKFVAYNSSAGVGQHKFRRGVMAICQVRKNSVLDVPAPLYIDGDRDPHIPSNAMTLRGADHNIAEESSNNGNGGGNSSITPEPSEDVMAYLDKAGADIFLAYQDFELPEGEPVLLADKGGVNKNTIVDDTTTDDGSVSTSTTTTTTDGSEAEGATSGQTSDAELRTGVAADSALYSLAWNPELESGGNDVYESDGVNLTENDAQISTLDRTSGAEDFGKSSTDAVYVDLDAMAEAYLAQSHETIEDANNHNDLTSAISGTSMDNFPVVHVKVAEGGKLTLSGGHTEGYGVLIIDGDLHITGQFSWKGLIIHRGGSLKVTGGGNNPAKAHVMGALLTNAEEVMVTGNADLWWCTETINAAKTKAQNSIRLRANTMMWQVLDSEDLSAMGAL